MGDIEIMRKIFTVGLLSILIASAGIQSVAAQSNSSETLRTFADWCIHKERLTPEARHTVNVLLRQAKTQDCNRAECELTKLPWLDLWNNQIKDVTPLASLTNLTLLFLDRNQIEDITPLANLTNLTELWIEQNQIKDVTSLANLTNLRWLGLSENQIEDVTPLASLTNLETLWLWSNQIQDVTSLASLNQLMYLNLRDNEIEIPTRLGRLTNQIWIRLNNNQIDNLASFVRWASRGRIWIVRDGNNRASNPFDGRVCPVRPKRNQRRITNICHF